MSAKYTTLQVRQLSHPMVIFIFDQANFQTHLPRKSNLSTYPPILYTKILFLKIYKSNIAVVIGVVDMWIGP
jgi:hypothetical protein